MTHHPPTRRRRRYLNIVFFVLGALLASFLVQSIVLSYNEQNWEQLEEEQAQSYLQAAAARFTAIQRDTRRLTTDLARKPEISLYLEKRSTDLVSVFREAAKTSERFDVGVEVYDGTGRLIAWSGLSGPLKEKEIMLALGGHLTSYVVPSGISSQLFVVTPVWSGDHVVGVILVRSTLDTNYPLNNRYVDPGGLSTSVNRDLGVSVGFDFGNRETDSENYYLSVPLLGIDSTTIGVVSVVQPTLSSVQDHVTRDFRSVQVFLAIFLLGMLAVPAWKLILGFRSLLLKCCAFTLLVWTLRYLLLWIDFPSMFFSGGVFDPTNYASKLGGGLAKSIGELTITSLALLTNTLIVGRFVLTAPNSRKPRWHWSLRWIGALVVMVLIFLLLRGYASILRSAVFDSSLLYTDPTIVVPSFEVATMVVNLFTISLCLILIAAGLILQIISFLSDGDQAGRGVRWQWIVIPGLLAVVAVFFEYAGHPLTSLEYRILFVVAIVPFTFYVRRIVGMDSPRMTSGSFLIPFGLATLFLYLQLDARISERDRDRVEAFAAEFLRPVDTWLTSVVDEALQLFNSEEVLNTLRRGTPEEIDGLALSVWSGSVACREGYSSLFVLTDSAGVPISRFSIGNQNLLPEQGLLTRLPHGRTVQMREIGTGVSAFKVYRGAVPVMSAEGVIGYAFVLVAAGQQTLFRGEIPVFLRSPAPESLESFYRPVTVAEFRDGKLFAATGDIFPTNFAIPREANLLFEPFGPHSLWGEITIDGDQYEALYVRGTADHSQVVALCLPVQGAYWHFFSLVKFLVYYILVVLVVLAAYLLLRWIRGIPYRTTFRDRLLAALLLTAIIPLVVIAYYGKGFAEQRLMEETSDRLKRETEAIALQVLGGGERSVNLSATAAEEIAGDVGTDFNIYVGSKLRVTTRPELYAAGLLDRRLSGSAYAVVMIAGERFFHQTEKVGRYRYSVGYRPVYNKDGSVLGIISVPTIYRQDELDRQVSRQNAFLFSVYAVVFLAIVVVASTVSGRIALPIHRLTIATRRVSGGDLDVSVGDLQADGEIGELVKSFETMTQNLKRQREDLIRFERELAWKEMAKQVAHEIKNPLTPMKLSLQHLRQIYRDKSAGFTRIFEEVVGTVIEQIDTLSRIATEFSRFAKMPAAHPERCAINEVVRESLRLFEQEKGISFRTTFDNSGPYVLADREELRRAFINIIRNGIQAMSGLGELTVRTGIEGDRVTIMFRDSGAGIPSEMKEKLFQPNFSTKSEGMGLGLALVKKTIDDMGGTIRLESMVRKGTTVWISLPLNGDEA